MAKSEGFMFDLSDPDRLTARVNVRLTQGEHQRLRDDAALAGLSVSELVRRRYFGRAIIASSDEATLRELRRLGGLLKHVSNEGGGIVKITAAMTDLQEAIKRLAT